MGLRGGLVMAQDVDPDEVVLARGPRGRILGVVGQDGSCPAREFLVALSAPAQAKIRSLMERLCMVGHINNIEQFRKLRLTGQPAVWEFKLDLDQGYRMYSIAGPGRSEWSATHGGSKPGARRVEAEGRRARRLFEGRVSP